MEKWNLIIIINPKFYEFFLNIKFDKKWELNNLFDHMLGQKEKPFICSVLLKITLMNIRDLFYFSF